MGERKCNVKGKKRERESESERLDNMRAGEKTRFSGTGLGKKGRRKRGWTYV
jgi:hypothetical protein